MGRYWGDRTWEIAAENWDSVRTDVRHVLEETARAQTTLSYSEIARRVPQFNGADSHALAEILGEICHDTHAEGFGLLTAVATFKQDPNSVGVGFFNIAKQLGYDVGDDPMARLTFWSRQVQRVYDSYA